MCCVSRVYAVHRPADGSHSHCPACGRLAPDECVCSLIRSRRRVDCERKQRAVAGAVLPASWSARRALERERTESARESASTLSAAAAIRIGGAANACPTPAAAATRSHSMPSSLSSIGGGSTSNFFTRTLAAVGAACSRHITPEWMASSGPMPAISYHKCIFSSCGERFLFKTFSISSFSDQTAQCLLNIFSYCNHFCISINTDEVYGLI